MRLLLFCNTLLGGSRDLRDASLKVTVHCCSSCLHIGFALVDVLAVHSSLLHMLPFHVHQYPSLCLHIGCHGCHLVHCCLVCCPQCSTFVGCLLFDRSHFQL